MRKIRDPQLLDRLLGLPRQAFHGKLWRMARAGRDPLISTRPKGRWDDGSFEVLYTALSPDAAQAELHYHLTRGQPVFPSLLQIHLHELEIDARQVYVFDDLDTLAPFGVEASRYGTSEYLKLQAEYSLTQQIGEAAHFLGCDGLIVPSARWPDQNVVVLPANLGLASLRHVKDYGPQDLKAWGRTNLK
jgi:RES domain-containing protein